MCFREFVLFWSMQRSTPLCTFCFRVPILCYCIIFQCLCLWGLGVHGAATALTAFGDSYNRDELTKREREERAISANSPVLPRFVYRVGMGHQPRRRRSFFARYRSRETVCFTPQVPQSTLLCSIPTRHQRPTPPVVSSN